LQAGNEVCSVLAEQDDEKRGLLSGEGCSKEMEWIRGSEDAYDELRCRGLGGKPSDFADVRLVRIALGDRFMPERRPGHGIRDVETVRRALPEGSGVRARRRVWSPDREFPRYREIYLGWTIVVAAPTAMSDDEWTEVVRNVMGLLDIDCEDNPSEFRAVVREDELLSVEMWESAECDEGGVSSGLWSEVRAAVGL
jgi:hypothetical protein